ncbi:carbohydrate ABC transporter permease [Actinobacteria bacterium YIM 96077]|uniref:Carbohydrate ABC transporter permease n=1 Tax=Phytoactinopolyspora halophila TaxID=1981511 RepID=A0A329QMZ4_9ACTN|nr:carbohydrate ABC transporter permease [Phytoactinopolyspora halophila]AYY12347.1 carbohydrate ABC transporter permease [Actinobacteria bacterium YIM 96077]RAW13735.1 carbohydrate ABC transporter permease [Phytoactinopolyspora halophila]
MRPRAGSKIGGVSVRYAVLVILALMVLLPFVSIILAALHAPGSQISGLSIPDQWSWQNFTLAWEQGNFTNLMRSSMIIAFGVVPLAVLLATLAAYGLSILKVWGNRVLSLGFVLGLTLPVELVVVALYFNLREVGLTNSYIGIILAEAALFLPFGVYWMQAHFSSMPEELVEAARIDGARDMMVLVRVLLPISWPAITTLSVLYFMWSWNQFLLVLVMMQDPDRRTAPAGLGLFVGQYSTDIPLLAAASVIVIAPIVIVYLTFQRSFVNGITQGAVKG